MAWVEDFAVSDPCIARATCNVLKKVSLEAAFTANLSLAAMQFSTKALAANVVVRRNIWLCQWEVDQGSQVRLLPVPHWSLPQQVLSD